MYQYKDSDQRLFDDQVALFCELTERFVKGRLSEDDFRPQPLQNGLYVQRHSPLLRVAIAGYF